MENINIDDEIKEEDLADVLGGIPYELAVDRVINGISKNLSNKSIEELKRDKMELEEIKRRTIAAGLESGNKKTF